MGRRSRPARSEETFMKPFAPVAVLRQKCWCWRRALQMTAAGGALRGGLLSECAEAGDPH